MEYQLTDAVPADEPWLERLRRAVYAELFDATWGGWDEARHRRHFAECIAEGHIAIVETDGIRVGIIQIFEAPDVVDVGEIQIWPEYQNRAIGSRLLQDVIGAAHAAGKPVRLKTGLKNRALRLYVRLGFRVVAESATHFHLEYAP